MDDENYELLMEVRRELYKAIRSETPNTKRHDHISIIIEDLDMQIMVANHKRCK